jgi:hypothetical protein
LCRLLPDLLLPDRLGAALLLPAGLRITRSAIRSRVHLQRHWERRRGLGRRWRLDGCGIRLGIGELLLGGAGDPQAACFQQLGKFAFLGLAEQQRFSALAPPNAAIPEEEPPGPLQRSRWIGRSGGGCTSSGWDGSRTAPVAGWFRAAFERRLGPREDMPELHPQAGAAPVGAEQGRHALRTAAALGVGGPPEGRHRPQRRRQGCGEGIGATGLAQRLPQLGAQAVAAGLVGRPAGGSVLVVEPGEALQQIGAGVGLGSC